MESRNYKPVDSSNISGVFYDEGNALLYVKFNNGAEYRYQDVPKDVYHELLSDPSPGAYLHDSIKGSYSYSRV